jgi:hypothetical protein
MSGADLTAPLSAESIASILAATSCIGLGTAH